MFERLDPPERFTPGGGFKTAVVARGRRIRRRRHRVVGGALASVVVVVAAVGVTAGWSRERWKDVERVDVQGLPPEVDALDGEPFTVLVTGVDSPFPLDSGVQGMRSDTIAAVRVEPEAGKVEVTSIPRDLWVEIPGHGEQRINQALELGGPALLVSTVESALGIDVDRYLQIDFEGFKKAVDAADLRIDFAYPMRSATTGFSVVEAGCQEIDGIQALALVRARRDVQQLVDGQWRLDQSGDLGRVHRQQLFGLAMLESLRSASDFRGKARLLLGYADDVVLDTRWTAEQLDELIDFAADLEPSDITTATIPVTDAVIDGAQVLLQAEGDDGIGPIPDPTFGPC